MESALNFAMERKLLKLIIDGGRFTYSSINCRQKQIEDLYRPLVFIFSITYYISVNIHNNIHNIYK